MERRYIHPHDCKFRPFRNRLHYELAGIRTQISKHSRPFGTAHMSFYFFCSAFLFPEGEFGVNPKPYLGALAVFGPAVVAASVLLGIILIETKGPQGLLVRSTQWFGILTYAIYVCHEPVYTAVRRLAPQKLDIPQSLVWLGIAIVLSGSVAAISYVLVERPFDRARQR